MGRHMWKNKAGADASAAPHAPLILTDAKIFQFPHSACHIIGQHALCGKENLIVGEYNTGSSVCMAENPVGETVKDSPE